MPDPLPIIYLARHGETSWTVARRHAGHVDVPLNEEGERDARLLGERLRPLHFGAVFTSPLSRVTRTCELAGFKSVATVDPDLVEWDYGEFEGKTPEEIVSQRPDWESFRDGYPGGDTAATVGARADRVLSRLRLIDRNVLLFSSGRFMRVLAARWLGLDPQAGRFFVLGTASVSALGYEDTRSQPVIRLWNDRGHL